RRYEGPYDALPAVRKAFDEGTRDDPATPYQHRVIPWTEVGEDEGTGIVHIAPGAGAEDYQLGKSLGLPTSGRVEVLRWGEQRDRAPSTSRRGPALRTTSWARASASRSSGRSTGTGATTR